MDGDDAFDLPFDVVVYGFEGWAGACEDTNLSTFIIQQPNPERRTTTTIPAVSFFFQHNQKNPPAKKPTARGPTAYKKDKLAAEQERKNPFFP